MGIVTDYGPDGFKIIVLNHNKKALRERMVAAHNVSGIITKQEDVYIKLCELNFDMNQENIVKLVREYHLIPKYEENVLIELENYNHSHHIAPCSLVAFYCKMDRKSKPKVCFGVVESSNNDNPFVKIDISRCDVRLYTLDGDSVKLSADVEKITKKCIGYVDHNISKTVNLLLRHMPCKINGSWDERTITFEMFRKIMHDFKDAVFALYRKHLMSHVKQHDDTEALILPNCVEAL